MKDIFLNTPGMKWETVFPVPSQQEIARYRNLDQRRSPYIAAWLTIPHETRYTEYSVDFRVSHLPRGTYCCLGNWTMDYSSLEKQYKSVRTAYDSVHAYAGFQRIDNGQTVSIMSHWDVYCRDRAGKEFTIQARRLYPNEVIGGGRFWGEGSGTRSTAPFDWEADHWYRMHLKCVLLPAKTLLEQWVYDIETGACTLLCRYDISIADALFKGSIAVFLENYLPETAGQVRSMEICNARYKNADTGRWQRITQAYVTSQGGIPQYEGSYNFGVSGNRLWMITSGVGGDWFHNGKGKKGTSVRLEEV